MDTKELKERFKSGERDFSGVDWTGSDLHGSIEWNGIILVGANLTGVNLTGAMIDNANLEGVCFDEATLLEVRFQNTNLRRVNFDNSILVSSFFDMSDADDASFREADIRMASFQEVTLRRTIWIGGLEGDNGFTDTDFTGCQYTPDFCDYGIRVIMPNGKTYTTPGLENFG